jgi:hypothetical protein
MNIGIGEDFAPKGCKNWIIQNKKWKEGGAENKYKPFVL